MRLVITKLNGWWLVGEGDTILSKGLDVCNESVKSVLMINSIISLLLVELLLLLLLVHCM